MPVHPDVQGVLNLLEELGVQDFSELTPEEARALSLAPPPEVPTAVGSVNNRTIAGPAADIPLRIYQPEGAGPHPGLVFFHGGGWVIGDLDSHDETCRRLCRSGNLTVIAVDYRLAPETRFPGAAEDCYAATCWVADNAAELNVDPGRLAVGGDSAGGNLAAVTALRARDEGSPALKFQLLIYPVTGVDFATPSYTDNAEGYLLSRRAMVWFWDHYAPAQADRTNPYAAPLAASETPAGLANLPPALVQTAEFDPLRDEGEAYAAALTRAGVSTSHTRYDGLIHGYFGMEDMIGPARAAFAEAVESLKIHLAP